MKLLLFNFNLQKWQFHEVLLNLTLYKFGVTHSIHLSRFPIYVSNTIQPAFILGEKIPLSIMEKVRKDKG